MKHTVLARRYAKALFDLAVERNMLEKIHGEVTGFNHSIESNADFRLFLSSQDLSKNEKKAKIKKLLQDHVSSVFYHFILVLLRKNRQIIFQAIAREFEILVDKKNKRLPATAITALPLDSTSQSELKELLDKTFDADVQITSEVDEAILGGIVVNVEGYVFDGSLQNQLQRLRKQLIESTNSK